MELKVIKFAELMQFKLDKNKHKACETMNPTGEGRTWDKCSTDWLTKRMLQEVQEMVDAIDQNKDPKEIAKECADIGNFAMMIADRVGGLDETVKRDVLYHIRAVPSEDEIKRLLWHSAQKKVSSGGVEITATFATQAQAIVALIREKLGWNQKNSIKNG